MRKIEFLIALSALILLVFPLPQSIYGAVPPPGDDVFGMYADDNFNDDASDENPTFVFIELGVVQVFIYLTNVSAPTIGGYEFALAYDSSGELPIVVDAGLPPYSFNVAPLPEYVVGLAVPMLPDEYGHAILATPVYFVYVSTPVYVSVTPTSMPMVPDQIIYIEFDDTSIWHAMHPASGNFIDPIFAFNMGIVAVENATWTDVKALYR